MRNQGPSAWAGYGDTGYVARPRTSRKAARAKSKAFQAYGATYGGKPKKQASKGTKKRYAALDTGAMIDTAPAKSLTGGGVRWVASASCLNGAPVGRRTGGQLRLGHGQLHLPQQVAQRQGRRCVEVPSPHG